MKLAGEQGAIETVGWGHMMDRGHASGAESPSRIAAHAKQALEIAERLGDAFSRAWAWFWVGSAACMQGGVAAGDRSARAIACDLPTSAEPPPSRRAGL